MFRSLPDFQHLGARTAPQAGARPRVGLNLDAPSGTVPSGTMASTVSVRAVTPTLTKTSDECVRAGCHDDKAGGHSVLCLAHYEQFLDWYSERAWDRD